jgi:restriction system protein
MAKRKRRRPKRSSNPAFVPLVFILLGTVAMGSVGRAIANHGQGIGQLIAVSFWLTIAFFVGRWVWRRRNRMLAARKRRAVELQQWAEEERQRGLWNLRAQSVAEYHNMDAGEFEHALAYLCERDGCTDVQVVGGAGDFGADVTAVTPQGLRLIIQAKRYSEGNRVSSPDMQKFGGTCRLVHGAQVAAIVTTSRFTKDARHYAQVAGIQAFDNDALAAWVSKTGPSPWTAR